MCFFDVIRRRSWAWSKYMGCYGYLRVPSHFLQTCSWHDAHFLFKHTNAEKTWTHAQDSFFFAAISHFAVRPGCAPSLLKLRRAFPDASSCGRRKRWRWCLPQIWFQVNSVTCPPPGEGSDPLPPCCAHFSGSLRNEKRKENHGWGKRSDKPADFPFKCKNATFECVSPVCFFSSELVAAVVTSCLRPINYQLTLQCVSCTIFYLWPKTVSLHSSYIYIETSRWYLQRITRPGVAVLFVSVMSYIQRRGGGEKVSCFYWNCDNAVDRRYLVAHFMP